MDAAPEVAPIGIDRHRIGSNILAQLIGKAVGLFVNGLGLMLLVNPYIGKAGVGIYAAVGFYVFLVHNLMDFGMTRIVVRELSAQKRSPELLMGNVLLIKIVTAVALIVLTVPFLAVISRQDPDFTLCAQIVSFTAIPWAFQMLICIFQARLHMEKVVIADIARNLLLLGLYLLFVFSPKDHQFLPIQVLIHGEWRVPVPWFFAAQLASFAVHSVLLVIFSRGLVRPVFRVDRELCKMLFSESVPLGIAAVLSAAYAKIDSVMLLMMVGKLGAGAYGAAYQYLDQVLVIPQVIGVTLFPLMSYYAVHDKEHLKTFYQKSLTLMFAGGLFIALMLSGFSKTAVQIIYRQNFLEFKDAVPCLAILAWASLTPFMGHLVGSTMIALGEQRRYVVYTTVGLVINFFLNLIIIPRYFQIGAAVVTIITELCVFLPCLLYVNRFIGSAPPAGDWLRVSFSGLVAFCMAHIALLGHVPWYLAVPVVALTYIGLISVLGITSRREIAILLRLRDA